MKLITTAFTLLGIAGTTFAQISADRAISTARTPGFRTSERALQNTLNREIAQQAPELYPGEIDDVGPQFLVFRDQPAVDGKATVPQRHQWVEGFADTQLFYTS